MTHAHELHRERAPKKLGFFVITVSTSRFERMSKREVVVDESAIESRRQ